MNNQNNPSDYILKIPAHPFSGRALWDKLRRALAEERGFKITLNRMARIAGKGTSTAEHWLSLSEQPHVRGFACLLERLSDEERARVIREICRTFATVLHPRIAYSPSAVEAILAILRQTQGMTIISGPTVLRTFLLMAMGHTYPQLDRRHRTPSGLDLYQPDRIVPIETVVYVRNSLTREQLVQAVRHAWPDIQKSTSPILLFNGVWSSFPEYREEILGWARERHVVIADSAPPSYRTTIRQGVTPVHVVTVSQLHENPSRIQVTCQAFGL